MKIPASLLRINVGFIAHEGVGFSRTFPFDLPHVLLPPDLEVWSLHGEAQFTRTRRGLLARIAADAFIQTECVRCLDDFRLPLHVRFSEVYAFSARAVTESGLLLPEHGFVDLAPLLREYLWLAVPINPLCRADCAGLCPECGQNLNHEDCGHTPNQVDPRLEVLRALLNPDDASSQD